MNDSCIAAVKIDQDLCSRCAVCYSLCPFEAIERRSEDGRLRIDIQKCQVCGICYSSCPSAAIDMAYYDYDDLIGNVQELRVQEKADTLVVMCRGNTANKDEVKEILSQNGLEGCGHISIRVPCAGRIPTDFIFKSLNLGFQRIVSVQCQDGFCRMKEGTGIETRRLMLSKAVLKQLGFAEDSLIMIKHSRKAVWISKECVGCGKCYFICPYEAILAEPFSSPRVLTDKCVGCGACQLVCPHHAIQVKGFEFDTILNSYQRLASKMKASNKAPAIMVFSCQWSEYSALDDPLKLLKEHNAIVLEVPCFKGLDPVHMINALRSGFDGVMAVICPAKDCKLQKGRDTSERQLEVLLSIIERYGLRDRFEVHELSPRCEGEFDRRFRDFIQKISTLSRCGRDAQGGM
ncbi:MAG: hydrogenase iron-sulfur subunit [Methanomassiliicoccales archaeon]|nr:MAG: hydrogenase iron-sulfur subunit [Methanomassiliicoccales archaeon]